MRTTNIQNNQLALRFSLFGIDISATFEQKMIERQNCAHTLPADASLSQVMSYESRNGKMHHCAVFIDFTHLYTRAEKEQIWVDDTQLYQQLMASVSNPIGIFGYLVVRPEQKGKIERLERIGFKINPRVIPARSNNLGTRKDIDT